MGMARDGHVISKHEMRNSRQIQSTKGAGLETPAPGANAVWGRGFGSFGLVSGFPRACGNGLGSGEAGGLRKKGNSVKQSQSRRPGRPRSQISYLKLSVGSRATAVSSFVRNEPTLGGGADGDKCCIKMWLRGIRGDRAGGRRTQSDPISGQAGDARPEARAAPLSNLKCQISNGRRLRRDPVFRLTRGGGFLTMGGTLGWTKDNGL